MYFAQMYCYGFDVDIVGISGIRGCIGVVYVGHGAMYAIHIPDNGPDKNALGGSTFATWVRGQQNVGIGFGHLFVFVNGSERQPFMGTATMKAQPGAAGEALAIKQALGSPPTTLYRIMKHLGPKSGRLDAKAVVIKVLRQHSTTTNPSGCDIRYKPDENIKWIDTGKKETDLYDRAQAKRFSGKLAPSDITNNWFRLDNITCTVDAI